ncbi:DUF2927 domain-containing protein [Mucilaginibacter arboris]|uniref:DUF2927 domain-containing protein n=1 Tax=Mucilaginibacter arboris TaxID=2682090 RepID=A0A7K1SVY3_9SPHI|nr:DUF2927 domain-containing protein [Mucilaginibacter arboris]MVN21481.1 DUF2927 domain-containing protein [Mucilaginibacter arboris]
MKTKILFMLSFFVTLSAFSQNRMSLVDKENFKTIALSKDQAGIPIIKKWVVPIHYKVYSAKGAYSIVEIDSIFTQIKTLTNLDIERAKNDDEVNFSVFLGGKDDFGTQVPSVTAQSFSKYGGTYYKFNNKGEIYQAIDLITVASFTDQRDVRNALRRSIIKLFGFFNPLENTPTSIFYSQSNNVVNFDAYDSFLVRLLYGPRFTAGMNSAQVDEALNKM